ncbi:hypothetical protein C8F01DRAFT_1271662 [Mycena amicta]|nr:hypothetical protein C8F01DRAFT_1271662 [Mycena amicta]
MSSGRNYVTRSRLRGTSFVEWVVKGGVWEPQGRTPMALNWLCPQAKDRAKRSSALCKCLFLCRAALSISAGSVGARKLCVTLTGAIHLARKRGGGNRAKRDSGGNQESLGEQNKPRRVETLCCVIFALGGATRRQNPQFEQIKKQTKSAASPRAPQVRASSGEYWTRDRRIVLNCHRRDVVPYLPDTKPAGAAASGSKLKVQEFGLGRPRALKSPRSLTRRRRMEGSSWKSGLKKTRPAVLAQLEICLATMSRRLGSMQRVDQLEGDPGTLAASDAEQLITVPSPDPGPQLDARRFQSSSSALARSSRRHFRHTE